MEAHAPKTCWYLAMMVALAVSVNGRFQDETNPVRGRELAAAVNLHQKDMKAEGTLFLPHEVRQFRAVIVVINWGPLSQYLFEDPQWRKLSEALASSLLQVRISYIGSGAKTRVTPSGRLVPDLAPVTRPERNAALDGVADAFLTLLGRFAEESGGSTEEGERPGHTLDYCCISSASRGGWRGSSTRQRQHRMDGRSTDFGDRVARYLGVDASWLPDEVTARAWRVVSAAEK